MEQSKMENFIESILKWIEEGKGTSLEQIYWSDRETKPAKKILLRIYLALKRLNNVSVVFAGLKGVGKTTM